MPEWLKSLLVILVLATAAFAFAKHAFRSLMTAEEFDRRRNLWLAITATAFLAHSFWLFCAIAGALLLVTASREENRIALFLFVILAVPPLAAEISGFGFIRYFFDMNYFRLAALAVLVPAFVQERAMHSPKHLLSETPDKFLAAYLVLNLALGASAGTLTGTSRAIFLLFLDVILPYALASRLLRDTRYLTSAIASYVALATVIATIGTFEFSRGWLLYGSLQSVFGIKEVFGGYLLRDDSLRANSSVGGPIVLGYVAAVGLCLLLGLRRFIEKKYLWLAGLFVLAMGLVSSFSRGPWVGCLAGLLIFALTDRNKLIVRTMLAAALLSPFILLTPLYDVIEYGFSTDTGSYAYRQQLLANASSVILQNPFFGAYDYIYSPAMQELKQGQGIIDIVNTYIAVGLTSGLVGLTIFVGFFLSALLGVWRRMSAMSDKSSAEYDVGRALLATIACIMVTIFTVSSVKCIPLVYYLIVGVAVGYARLGQSERRNAMVEKPAGLQPGASSPGTRGSPAGT